MTEKEKFLTFLSQFDLGVKKISAILNQVDTLDGFRNFDYNACLTKSMYELMLFHASEEKLNDYCQGLKENGVILITKESENYPQKLKPLDDAPYYLFCKGDISLLSTQSVAIIGSRTPSNYGRIITDRFASGLASAGLTIISGLAYGVDSIAHRKTLEVGGKTIVVLGGGFKKIYPAEHTALANEIAEKGLLVSEYSVNMSATKYTFPQRNRIIAGLSDGVLITEAGMRSGSVHTRDFALEYGRTVYAVPGNITSDKSDLTNEIIKTMQGQCVTSYKDILDDFDLKDSAKQTVPVQLGFAEQKIVEILRKGTFDFDELAKKSDLDTKTLTTYLTSLEISGIIRRMPGGLYSLA